MTPLDRDHLDDEALSAVLDGEATPDESAHADACPACATRLAELRDASMLVRSPVPEPDPARRDATIAAALAVAGAGGTVVPFRRRLPPAWLAAAAAVVVAVALVAVLPGRGNDDDSTTALDDRDASQEAGGDAAGGAELFAAAPVVDGGDLGEIAGTDLRDAVNGALAAGSSQRAAAPEAAADDEAAEDATTTDATAAIPCDDAVRTDYPLGNLVLHAVATFEGDPVVVLAYDVPPSDDEEAAHRWVFAVAVEGCVVKNLQTFVV